jgi:hypothetical protein
MRTQMSDTHFLIWESGYLTSDPAAAIDAPTRTGTESRQASPSTGRARRSSTFGTDDPYCHIFVGAAPYRYTSCGLRLKPPVPLEKTHRKPPCPNGHPPCPECVQAREEDAA